LVCGSDYHSLKSVLTPVKVHEMRARPESPGTECVDHRTTKSSPIDGESFRYIRGRHQLDYPNLVPDRIHTPQIPIF